MFNPIEQELAQLGITQVKEIVRNPSYEQLFEEEMALKVMKKAY